MQLPKDVLCFIFNTTAQKIALQNYRLQELHGISQKTTAEKFVVVSTDANEQTNQCPYH
jgi:hypothetical protein